MCGRESACGCQSSYKEITISLCPRLLLAPSIDVLQYNPTWRQGEGTEGGDSACLEDNTKIGNMSRSSWLV